MSRYEHLPMGSEFFLADIDPKDDHAVRIALIGPAQVCLEVVQRTSDLGWKSEGAQIVVSADGLIRALTALTSDDYYQTAEKEGVRFNWRFDAMAETRSTQSDRRDPEADPEAESTNQSDQSKGNK